jgi:hypothetical protein
MFTKKYKINNGTVEQTGPLFEVTTEDDRVNMVLAGVPEQLAMGLTDDPSKFVLCCLAERTRYRTVLEKLANHSDEMVRREVASNPAAGYDLLYKLAQDPSPQVRLAVLRGRSYIPGTIDRLLMDDPEDEVRTKLASRRGLQPDVYEKLANDPSETVRAALALAYPDRHNSDLTQNDKDVTVTSSQKPIWQRIHEFIKYKNQ